MSISTVVSLCNYPIINEHKPTIQPSYYSIPAADKELKIAVLHIMDAICYEYASGHRSIMRDVMSKEVAKSVVDDYSIAQLCLENGAKPGLFWVEGKYSEKQVLNSFEEEIEEMTQKHTLWAKQLVKMGDDLWSVHKQHRHITRTMIDGATFLGLTREWTEIPSPENFMNCPACGDKLLASVVLCKTCKCVIDAEKYSKLTFAI